MATDTAFAVALIVMMGSRVPVELRIFLTAAAIVDDIGAILVVAVFYSNNLQLEYLAAAAVIVGALALLNRSHVYLVQPYVLLGIALWACVLASGLHATLGRRHSRAVHSDASAAQPAGVDEPGHLAPGHGGAPRR